MKTTDFHDVLDEYRKPLLVTGAALALILAALFSTDLRQTQVTLTVPVPGSAVLVDNALHGTTNNPSQKVELSLTPGLHMILIAVDDRHPWTKEITLSPGEREELLVFNFPEKSFSEPVASDHPAQSYTPSAEPIKEIVSADGNVRLESDGGILRAHWIGDSSDMLSAFCFEGSCNETITILESVRKIEDIGFLDTQGRIALFVSSGNVYALELNTEGTQNFQPIYVGTAPRLVPADDGIYVRDDGELRRIAL
ncbi:MAG: hypothetical protein WDZ70_02655 [Candidatus Paceibacterota bacterium]